MHKRREGKQERQLSVENKSGGERRGGFMQDHLPPSTAAISP